MDFPPFSARTVPERTLDDGYPLTRVSSPTLKERCRRFHPRSPVQVERLNRSSQFLSGKSDSPRGEQDERVRSTYLFAGGFRLGGGKQVREIISPEPPQCLKAALCVSERLLSCVYFARFSDTAEPLLLTGRISDLTGVRQHPEFCFRYWATCDDANESRTPPPGRQAHAPAKEAALVLVAGRSGALTLVSYV